MYRIRGRGSLGHAIEGAELELRYRLMCRSFRRRFHSTGVTPAAKNGGPPKQEEEGSEVALHAGS